MEIRHRYFAELAYNGTAYHGWQVQPNGITVQEVLNKALSTYFRQEVDTVGCGRTDTGVHATKFFAHFELENIESPQDALQSINALLPYDVAVKRIFTVEPEAHARFDATQRAYEYHIHFNKDPFMHNLSWLMRDMPDVDLMNRAAEILMEYTDFSCFSKSHTQTYTNNCKISLAEWIRYPDAIVFHISADRFLRNMVRAIVGTLLRIGRKEITPDAIRLIIESGDRSNAGVSVPACGLFLTDVKYPYV